MCWLHGIYSNRTAPGWRRRLGFQSSTWSMVEREIRGPGRFPCSASPFSKILPGSVVPEPPSSSRTPKKHSTMEHSWTFANIGWWTRCWVDIDMTLPNPSPSSQECWGLARFCSFEILCISYYPKNAIETWEKEPVDQIEEPFVFIYISIHLY